MTALPQQIGFIGGGNMAEAIAGALIRAGVSRPDRIRISDPSPERRHHLQQAYGLATTTDNTTIFNLSAIIVLAVKPQVMTEVLTGLAAGIAANPPTEKKLVVSIAAGVTIKQIEQHLYAHGQSAELLPVIRVMPNTPALVQAGMSGLSANEQATEEDLFLAEAILAATGKVLTFPEADLNAVTAVSGSGPAYVFYLVEAMIDAGVNLGLKPDAAGLLTLQTLRGALALLEESREEPALLRRKVTSPGGTTEAALRVMEERQVRESIMAAMTAACRRAEELSD